MVCYSFPVKSVDKWFIKNHKAVDYVFVGLWGWPGTMYILASSITRFTFIVLRNTHFLVWYGVVCIKLPVAICVWWYQVVMCTNTGNNNMALEVIRGDLDLHLAHIRMESYVSDVCCFAGEFATYLNFCRSLRFDDKPDYAYLRQLFRNLFHKLGYTYDYVFDWNTARLSVSVQRNTDRCVLCVGVRVRI